MNRHTNVLQDSRPDDIALCSSVEAGFLEVCGLQKRLLGVELVVPESMKPDMLRWRTMRKRHKQGDFRNTEAELKSLQAVAQWTLDMKMDLRNQPREVLQWR
jgi:hypothetical protein